MIELAGFRVEERVHVGRSLVSRAVRLEDGQRVVLKALHGRAKARQAAAVRREYDLLRLLEGPWVVPVLGLERSADGPVLVLADNGSVSLASLCDGHLPLADFFALAEAMATGLAEIHRRGVVHKDLKPANLVFRPGTHEVRYIDFNIATQLHRESLERLELGRLEGSLPYLAPEQTGRMHRAIDARSDLYSLGATFFELLTGRPPFVTRDPLELLHCHLAREPVTVRSLRAEVPAALSLVVARLLSKAPEDRYQSATGLRADLAQLRAAYAERLEVQGFVPGLHDVPDRLRVSQKVYGRESELTALLAAFARASEGRPELVTVSGYSGIGKSTLVGEVEKPMTERHGYFVRGKFDQLRRNVPFASLLQAFGELVRQLLAEGDERLEAWRVKLVAALGPNGGVLTEVLPELALVLGAQPAVEQLGPTETQNRFKSVFRNFVRALSGAEHPLVVFLDDLQWADLPSLTLLETLLTDPDATGLLILSAYRDNEVDETHPLTHTLAALEAAGTRTTHLRLGALSLPHVAQLLADSLCTTPARSLELAQLVHERTGGNPFFVGEFLFGLQDDGLLRAGAEGWSWDTESIRRKNYTHNVVDFLSERVRRLDPATQRVLRTAACLGSRFALHTLAVVCERSPLECARALAPAVEQGFVLPLGDNYRLLPSYGADELADAELDVDFRFLHDRLQQTAWELVPEAERPAVRLSVGRLLLAHLSPAQREEQLFDLVAHFLAAGPLLTDSAERRTVAGLALEAGQRAARSTAFAPAVQCLEGALALATPLDWERDHAFAYALQLELGRALFLVTRTDEAEAHFATLLSHARTELERAQVCTIQLALYQTIGALDRLLDLAFEAVNRLGLGLSARPTDADVGAEMGRVQTLMAGRSFDDVATGPAASKPEDIAMLNLLAFMGPAAYLAIATRPNFWQLSVLKCVNFMLEHGVSAAGAAYALPCLGIMLAHGAGQYELAYEWGKLGVRITERFGDRIYVGMATYLTSAFLETYVSHFDPTVEKVERSFQLGLDSGNLLWASMTHSHSGPAVWQRGDSLDEVILWQARCFEFARRIGYVDSSRYHTAIRQTCRALQGLTRDPLSLDDEHFNEADFVREFEHSGFKIPLHTYLVCKMQLAVIHQRYPEARAFYAQSKATLLVAFGLYQVVDHHFYGALAQLGDWTDASPEERDVRRVEVLACLERLRAWARSGPDNTLARLRLVEAEWAVAEGRTLEAVELFEQCLAAARKSRFVHLEALCSERAARMWQGLERERLARPYLDEARDAWDRWGAASRVAVLDIENPGGASRLRVPPSADSSSTNDSASTTHSTSSVLDLASVLKAAHALSSELVLSRLLSRLLEILMESTGAQHGVLLLERKGRWLVEAERDVDHSFVPRGLHQTLEAHGGVPASVVAYTFRTREAVILHDASAHGAFARDPVLHARKTLSVFCAPIVHKGNVVAMAYLEHGKATGVFTPERLALVRAISAQAAVSLENAALYERLAQHNEALEAQVAERTRELRARNDELLAWQQRLRGELAEALAFVRSLLPGPLEGTVRARSLFVPSAELGGDAFGYRWLDERRLAVFVMDACGHGIAPAMLSVSVLTALLSGRLQNDPADPRATLVALNEAFPSERYGGLFFTMWYGVYDTETRGLVFASAGHPPALLVGPEGTRELCTWGPIVGVAPELEWQTERVTVAPGERLYVFSDGAYEVDGPQGMYSFEQLRDALVQGADEAGDRALAAVRSWHGHDTLPDDFSLLELRFS